MSMRLGFDGEALLLEEITEAVSHTDWDDRVGMYRAHHPDDDHCWLQEYGPGWEDTLVRENLADGAVVQLILAANEAGDARCERLTAS
ncbi:hypothetical protein [Halobacteriaceae bacterium SHR40]|uniref:hypothetical protein n=1 Tax=Halovenus amylolytica TaxID=2500550 RepID=UPI000FE42FBA